MSTWYTGGEHDVARSQLSSAAQLEGELYCLRHLVGMVGPTSAPDGTLLFESVSVDSRAMKLRVRI